LVDGDDSDPLVLTVDFDASGRMEARFSDLVPNLKPGHRIWETVPPAEDGEAARSGPGYVEHWLRPVERERPRVAAVMGFCAGSVYAAALAERIAGWQEEPTLVLIDPELSTPQTLMWQFQKVVGFLASGLTEPEMEAAAARGQHLYDNAADVHALKAGLVALMREAGEPALIRAGLDETRRAELIGVFGSFLQYLAAAGDLDPRPRWRSAVALCSGSPLSGMNAMRASGLGADQVGVAREIDFAVEHAVMLADHGVAAAVSELLAG
jgi:hypothetical protein